MDIHPSLTPERIAAAVEWYRLALEDPGFCIACGEEAQGVEPDARDYTCEACGAARVYGAEVLLIMVMA